MSLDAGTRVGAYEVVSPLGAGGMGEVYRARDARLKRDVALKILPAAVGDDPDRLARFEREAQALAAMNHPNIAAIYGFEEGARAGESTVRALVLELVEGETLAERIARGPVPVSDALAISKQIASALEAAHEQGIVHRDLKPANIKITPEGVVKVLDFGLAKLAGGPPEGGPHVRSGSNPDLTPTIAASMSPTMTTPALTTGAGVLLGTAAYMSPEQARGRAADKRADIWAFGVVLYEMLTGSRAFGGDTVTETAGAVIHKELDLSALPADLPSSARTVLRRSLQKDPLQRVRDMGDVRLALDGAFAIDATPPAAAARTSPMKRLLEIGVVAVIVGALSGALVWWLNRPLRVERFPVRIDVSMGINFAPILNLSPDGRHFAVIGGAAQGEPQIWVHSLETGESRALESAGVVRQPVFSWSPDSRSIAFVSEGKLKRVEIAGGAPQTICDVKQFGGATWTRDNVMLFSDTPTGGILKVSATGGTPVLVTKPPAEAKAVDVLPWALPDGRHFLYVRTTGTAGTTNKVFVGSLDVGSDQQEKTELMTSSRHVIYAAAVDGGVGRLLFTRDNTLMTQGFDERSRALVGDAAPVVEPVAFINQLGAFAASSNGTLVYVRGGSDTGSLVWTGHDGQQLTTIAPKLKDVRNPRLSPDERTLAVIVGGDLWSYDVGGRPPIRLTFSGGGGVHAPVFTKDGRRVIYESDKPRGLFAVASDGSGGMPELVSPPGHFHPHSWSADGQIVAGRLPDESQPKTSVDLVRFAASKDATVQAMVETPASEGVGASLSPDGRWVAYSSDSTGASEVWVRPFPGPGAPIRVSPNGGIEPVWSRSGKELYYLQGASLMSVAIESGGTFNFKPPTRLFESPYQRGTQPPTYDVASDGRFVMVKSDSPATNVVSVILNWQELLQKK